MTSYAVHIPDELVEDIEKVIADGAFGSTEEFVASAVERRLLDLQRDEFYDLTEGIHQGLRERGYTIRQVLDEIERLRREDHQRYGEIDYQQMKPKAQGVIGERDPKDVDILALALAKGAILWTEDRDFEGIPEIMLVRTKDLI